MNCKSRSVLGTSNCKSTSIYQYCARLKTSLHVWQFFTKITLASWFPSQNELSKNFEWKFRIQKSFATCHDLGITLGIYGEVSLGHLSSEAQGQIPISSVLVSSKDCRHFAFGPADPGVSRVVPDLNQNRGWCIWTSITWRSFTARTRDCNVLLGSRHDKSGSLRYINSLLIQTHQLRS